MITFQGGRAGSLKASLPPTTPSRDPAPSTAVPPCAAITLRRQGTRETPLAQLHEPTRCTSVPQVVSRVRIVHEEGMTVAERALFGVPPFYKSCLESQN